MTGNDILKALLELKDRNPAALDAVALVCEVEPSANFDNSGFPIERIGHEIAQNPDPGELGILYFHARGVEPLPTRGTVELDGVYISDTLFAEWPDTDGGNTIRVKDEHGNTVERVDRDSDDPVEQARWNELRDLMPDDAFYFQPEGACDPD